MTELGARGKLMTHLFTDRAQQAIRAGRREAERAGAPVLDSRFLLVGLSHDLTAWPPGEVRGVVQACRGGAGTEREGEIDAWGMRLSREVEVVLREAVDAAAPGLASSRHVLYQLSLSGGSDASLAMRAVVKRPDPWQELRAWLARQLAQSPAPSLAPPECSVDAPRASGRERVVALLYVLMRDHLCTGVLEGITHDLEDAGPFEFTGKELEALAGRYADRLFA